MRFVNSSILLLLAVATGAASDIREFDIPTLERLGNELSRRDEIAARASNAVFDTQPAARALKLRGWVSELSKDGDKVYLTTAIPSGSVLAYTVIFQGEKLVVEDHRGEPLSPSVALRFKARNTAAAAVHDKLCKDASYNFEVLDDPAGTGFLVYALATTTKNGDLLTGGHYRITVSADGSKAERVDLLGPLIIQHADPKWKMQAIVSTQLSSNKPIETWLYCSHLNHLPVFVGTKDRSVWEIVNGEIRKLSDAEIAAAMKKPAKKK